MSINQVKKMALQYTLILVFVMGLVSILTLVTKPSGFDLNSTFARAERGPASIGNTALTAQTKFENEVSVIQFECKKNLYNVGAVSQIRIRGRTCKGTDSDRIKNSDIRNQATGLAATVFFSNETNNFTTDLIQLKRGDNAITIDNRLADGSKDYSEIMIRVIE